MVGLLRFRFAAGVCMLAAGLLMGAGGAVAFADPDSHGSAAHGDAGADASGPSTAKEPKKPKKASGGTVTTDDTNMGPVTSTLGSGRQPGEPPSTAKKPKIEPGAGTSGTGATRSGTGATTSGTGATTSGTGATTSGTGATTSGTGASTSGTGAT